MPRAVLPGKHGAARFVRPDHGIRQTAHALRRHGRLKAERLPVLCQQGKQAVLQRGGALLRLRPLGGQSRHGGGRLHGLCRQADGDVAVLGAKGVQHGKGTAAAGHLDARAAAEMRRAEQLDEADLARAGHMGAAAGAQVDVSELHEAHRARQGLFTAVREVRQLVRLRIPDMRRKIGPDGLVRGALQLLQGLLVHFAVKIDRHKVRAEVEADVLIAEARVDEAGDKMLTGVLLHEVQPPRPVDLARHVRAGRQSCRTAVQHRLAAQERLRDVRAAERAHVAGLAAARGIKDCAVQLHEPAVFTLLAGEHARLQPPGVRVRFIDADRVQGFPLRFPVFLLFYHKIAKNKRDFSAVSLDKRAARQYDKR